MEQEEKPQHSGGIYNYFQGATIHNMVINGNMTRNGTENYYGQPQQAQHQYSDEQVAQALTNIVGKGKPIDSKQKWTGALWMLHWMCGYPIKANEFCTRIEQLPLPSDLEFKCDYRNIRELATLSFISQDATQMDKVVPSKNDTPVFQQMRTVALAVAQELRAVTGQHD